MERAKVVKEELFEQNHRFLAVYVETKNSCLIMLSEKEDKLGTMALALPKPPNLLRPVSSSVIRTSTSDMGRPTDPGLYNP